MTALVWCQKDPNAEGKNMQKKKSLNTQQKYTFTNKNSSKIVLKNYFFLFLREGNLFKNISKTVRYVNVNVKTLNRISFGG